MTATSARDPPSPQHHNMNPSIQIAPAATADLADLALLFDAYRMFYGQPSEPAKASLFVRDRLTRDDSVILLARSEDGAALGFTQLYPTFSSIACRRAFVLNDLYIAEAARGRGVGRALLVAARAHALGVGAAYISLETAVDNTRAQALYESFGFRRDTQFLSYALSLC